MIKILKDLEYLIPLFAGMPTWVKSLFIGWLILSFALLFIVASITYSKNKQKALQDENFNLEVVKTQVNRLIEDFDATAKKSVEEYPKEINQIKNHYNKNGVLHSSMHIRKQYDTAIAYKEKIDEAYKNLVRKIEDIMLRNFKKKDINTIPEMEEKAEKIKSLHEIYENEKKKFEEEPRKLDLQIDKNNPIISENFKMTRY